MSWFSKLFKAEPEEVVVARRPKCGYEIHSDGSSYWKVITDEERFYDYVENLKEKVFGSEESESES